VKGFVSCTFMSRNMLVRAVSAFVFFWAFLILGTVASFYLLPDGALLAHNSIWGWDVSSVWMECILIFILNSAINALLMGCNQLSVPYRKPWLAVGYIAMFMQFAQSAITIGTWSFSMQAYYVPDLATRLLGSLDMAHRAMIWELTGMILIVSSTARSIVTIDENGEDVYARALKMFGLTTQDKIALGVGILLLAIAATIEALAVVNAW